MTRQANVSAAVLAAELVKARTSFDAAVASGVLRGRFHDAGWTYRGVTLHLTVQSEGGSSSRGSRMTPLSPIAGDLARCYLIATILKRPSLGLAVSRVNAFRWLATTLGSADVAAWAALSKAQLDATVRALKTSTSYATTYHRACGLSAFVEYLNTLHAKVEGIEHRFCERFIRWTHGVPNPIRSTLELTSPAHESRKKQKYEPNLHIAIAKARALISSDPSLEPFPGFDRIRLESLAFPMALGSRVGELCTLSVNVLESIEETGQLVARIPTEKLALASATAVPEVWKAPVLAAAAYLLEQCSPARMRAREIEESGFQFVYAELAEVRRKNPLPEERLVQLRVLGKSPKDHCTIEELTTAFSVSFKEFSAGGKFQRCQVDMPRITAARMADWLDCRFAKWDWKNYAIPIARRAGQAYLTDADVGRLAGASKASVSKARWFRASLRKLLTRLHSVGVYEDVASLTPQMKDEIRGEWIEVRKGMLSRSGGGMCTMIDIGILITQLKERYAGYLSRHFQENFSTEGNSVGSGFMGHDVREGVERRLSEHLIVLWEYQFSGTASRGILPRPIFRSDYYSYLSVNGQKRTVFERHSILDSEDKPYSFTIHGIRRWVSTAVLRSGPSEIACDLWMGRSPSQSRHYDYRTAKERAEYVRDRYLENGSEPADYLGRKVRIWREEGMSDEQIEFLVTQKLTALHFTPWGTCSRELYISPCSKGLMCVRGFGTGSACESFQIDQDDLEAKKAIEDIRSKYIKMLQAIEPNRQAIGEAISLELSTSESLDQHLSFIVDVVRGCDEALKAYDRM